MRNTFRSGIIKSSWAKTDLTSLRTLVLKFSKPWGRPLKFHYFLTWNLVSWNSANHPCFHTRLKLFAKKLFRNLEEIVYTRHSSYAQGIVMIPPDYHVANLRNSIKTFRTISWQFVQQRETSLWHLLQTMKKMEGWLLSRFRWMKMQRHGHWEIGDEEDEIFCRLSLGHVPVSKKSPNDKDRFFWCPAIYWINITLIRWNHEEEAIFVQG